MKTTREQQPWGGNGNLQFKEFPSNFTLWSFRISWRRKILLFSSTWQIKKWEHRIQWLAQSYWQKQDTSPLSSPLQTLRLQKAKAPQALSIGRRTLRVEGHPCKRSSTAAASAPPLLHYLPTATPGWPSRAHSLQSWPCTPLAWNVTRKSIWAQRWGRWPVPIQTANTTL